VARLSPPWEAVLGEAPGAGQDGVDHVRREAAGEGVLLARVVAAHEDVWAHLSLRAMAEARPRDGSMAVDGELAERAHQP
jgi:hypothetical protein